MYKMQLNLTLQSVLFVSETFTTLWNLVTLTKQCKAFCVQTNDIHEHQEFGDCQGRDSLETIPPKVLNAKYMYFAFDNIFLSVYLKKTTIIMVIETYDWSNCYS